MIRIIPVKVGYSDRQDLLEIQGNVSDRRNKSVTLRQEDRLRE